MLVAPSRQETFLHQNPEAYTEAEHAVWATLYDRMVPLWERHAPSQYLAGLECLRLDHGRIPELEALNRFMAPRTGFVARAVSGYLPASLFFECLRRREFPTTITIRPAGQLDYLPEPDIFHDVCGHVPLHTDPAFADALVRFGECAARATQAASAGDAERIRETLARFFWYTVEFGLMATPQGLKACGSGLLSSFGELRHALQSPLVDRRPAELAGMIEMPFAIDRYQPVLFVLEGFPHLYSLIEELERSISG